MHDRGVHEVRRPQPIPHRPLPGNARWRRLQRQDPEVGICMVIVLRSDLIGDHEIIKAL